MNLLLLSPAELRGEHGACVEAARYPPRAGLWPPAPGRVLRAGLRNGALGSARVERVEDGRVHLALALAEDPPPPLPLTLVHALPRPKMLRRVLRSATELGIKRIVLLNSSRVEKSYWSSPLLAPERLESYLLTGLEQAGDSVLPEVGLRTRFRPFVEDELPSLAAGSRCLVAQPGAPAVAPRACNGALTLAIGPEGGFTGFELELLGAAGFAPVALGARTLRVETAVPALVAALTHLDTTAADRSDPEPSPRVPAR
jgi:RsmE family RNA methyltransferase